MAIEAELQKRRAAIEASLEELMKEELAQATEAYKEAASIDTLNALIYGDLGTRKTSFITTGRRPVYIHSFDPGGTKIPEIRKGIEEGWCFVELFEDDTFLKPVVFDRWKDRMDHLMSTDFFSGIGTYGIDSCAFFLRTMMNKRVKKEGRANGVPAIQDYLAVGTVMVDWLIRIAALPCDFIMTGHMAREQDEITGAFQTNLQVYRSMRQLIPQLFEETYVTHVTKHPKEIKVELLTENDGRYKAKTKIGGHKIFDRLEKMDIKHLLRKAGLDDSDKAY